MNLIIQRLNIISNVAKKTSFFSINVDSSFSNESISVKEKNNRFFHVRLLFDFDFDFDYSKMKINSDNENDHQKHQFQNFDSNQFFLYFRFQQIYRMF